MGGIRVREILTLSHQLSELGCFEEFQQETLNVIQRTFDAESCVFVLSRGVFGDKQVTRWASRGLPREHLVRYSTRYHRYDPFARWLREHQEAIPHVTLGEHLVDYRNFVRSKIYEEFFRTFSIHHILGINLMSRGNVFGFIGAYRARNGGPYAQRDLVTAELLARSLSTAAKRVLSEERLAELTEATQAMAAEHHFKGVVVLDGDLRPLCVNQAGQSAIAELNRARTDGASPADWCPEELRRCCRRISMNQGHSHGWPAEMTCELTVPRSLQRIHCHVRRLERGAFRPLFLVCLQPQTPLLCAADRMRATGLTQREVDVLLAASESLTNRQIAGRLSISVNTVQTHLRSIYGKLGVVNRIAAVRRLDPLRGG